MTEQSCDGAVLLTGASGGLGAAFAQGLARDGFEVVLVGRDSNRLEQVAEQAPGSCVRPLDLRQAGALEKLGAELATHVCAVVHAAAAFAPYGRLGEIGDEHLEAVLDVNLKAALQLGRIFAPAMARVGFGRFVFLGSVAARCGAHGQAAYAASKAGLIGAARGLALEYGGKGVTANVLELGLVDTPRVRAALGAEGFAGMASAAPVGRAASAEEVAGFVRYLLSPGAGFVTGALLSMDGGMGLGLPRAGAGG